MRFLGRLKVRDWRIVLSVGRVTRVQGVNSELQDGNHMLMWEFDDRDALGIARTLRAIQRRYALPEIRIAESHPGGGYHAYCWTRMPFIRTVAIVAATQGVDPGFIRMCCMRQHWTLRVTNKGKGTPTFYAILPSEVDNESATLDLKGGVHYEAYQSKDIRGPNWDAVTWL